jgi:hypothetical protein
MDGWLFEYDIKIWIFLIVTFILLGIEIFITFPAMSIPRDNVQHPLIIDIWNTSLYVTISYGLTSLYVWFTLKNS